MDAAIRFLSVCSGIEAASAAWMPLGWECVGVAEIEKFPSTVLRHHYPDVKNHGDFTKIRTSELGRVDVLCGGTPCQAFSVAGARKSLDDVRGNLTLAFVELAHELASRNGLRNIIWENVPGVLSTHDNAFGCFLAGLVGAGAPLVPAGEKPADGKSNRAYGWSTKHRRHYIKWPRGGVVIGPKGRAAWTVKDAQYFGLAQRRERVVLVADFGKGADPAAVLFEPEGVPRHSPPRRETGQGIAGTLEPRASGGGGEALIAGTVSSKWAKGTGGPAGDECYNLVAHTLRGEGFDASEDGTGRGTPIICVHGTQDPITSTTHAHALGRNSGQENVVAVFDPNQITSKTNRSRITPEVSHTLPAVSNSPICFSAKDYGADASVELSPTLRAGGHTTSHANAGVMPAVRRLTPRECERLMGFPDDYTRITWRGKPASECPDGPRYKALGNSWAVPKFRWVGQRIQKFMPKEESST